MRKAKADHPTVALQYPLPDWHLLVQDKSSIPDEPEFRPYKQMIERLNRTFKASYRVSCGYDNYEGANYNVAPWVAYYNFLHPHKHNHYQAVNKVEMLVGADNMPSKW